MKLPSLSPEQKSTVLFIAGLIWISYFAFFNPAALSPPFVVLGASCMFGPSVINLWKGDKDETPKP